MHFIVRNRKVKQRGDVCDLVTTGGRELRPYRMDYGRGE